MIEELYERIEELNSKLYWREDIEEIVRKMILKSHMTLGEVEEVFHYLNMPNNEVK